MVVPEAKSLVLSLTGHCPVQPTPTPGQGGAWWDPPALGTGSLLRKWDSGPCSSSCPLCPTRTETNTNSSPKPSSSLAGLFMGDAKCLCLQPEGVRPRPHYDETTSVVQQPWLHLRIIVCRVVKGPPSRVPLREVSTLLMLGREQAEADLPCSPGSEPSSLSF